MRHAHLSSVRRSHIVLSIIAAGSFTIPLTSPAAAEDAPATGAATAELAAAAPTTSASPEASAPPPVVVAEPVADASRPAATETAGASRRLLHEKTGVYAGARLGYALASGSFAGDVPMRDSTSGVGMLQGDLGLQLGGGLALGGYLGIGLGSAGGDFGRQCDATNYNCSVVAADIGLTAEYRFLPASPVDPWIGLLVGFEGFSRSASQAGYESSLTAYGLEFGASAGADVQIGSLSLGPFVTYRMGQFASTDYSINGTTVGEGQFTDNAFHQWLSFGLRGHVSMSK